MKVSRRPSFQNDLTEAYAYLTDRSLSAGERFFADVDATISLLSAFPDLGRPRDTLSPGVRSFRIRRFPHLIFYRRAADSLVLLRLLHGARQMDAEMMEEERFPPAAGE